jgi:uncharacterized glyoxalase superfamily protein PhnB
MVYNMQPMLQVRDLRESIAFYTDVLGFKVDGTWPEDAPRWAGLHSGNARIMLSAFDGIAEPQLTGAIYMYPDDLDAAWERLQDAVAVEEPLATRPYGMREFSFRDPDGYLITFGANAEPHEHDHPHEGDHGHPH